MSRVYSAPVPNGLDDTTGISAVAVAASVAGGGIVLLSGGTYFGENLPLYSNVIYLGTGQRSTTVKLKAGSTANVFLSDGFAALTGQNKWFTSENVPSGFGLVGMTVDGNKANCPSGGSGVKLYGKRYVIDDLVIINCHGYGFYSETGDKGGQTDETDMPESDIRYLFVKGCDNTAVEYRGPHDGHFSTLLTLDSAVDGLNLAYSAGVYNGAAGVDYVHSYSNNVGARITAGNSNIGTLITESNDSEGLIVSGGRTLFSQVYAYKNWASGPAATDSSVDIETNAQFGTMYVRTDNDGIGVKVGATGAAIGFLQCEGMSGNGIGLSVEANRANVRGIFREYDGGTGTGISYAPSVAVHNSSIFAEISACDTGFLNTSGGNRCRFDLTITGCTTPYSLLGSGSNTDLTIRSDTGTAVNTFSSMQNIAPTTDNSYTNGNASARWSKINALEHLVMGAAGDTVAKVKVSGNGLEYGAGGASALDLRLYRHSSTVLRAANKLTADSGIGVGNSVAATVLGSVVKKMEVFDATGTSLGFVPIYDTIT